MNIADIAKDGFTVDTVEASLYDVAFLSLRSALKAYYSSYLHLGYDAPWINPLNWTQAKLDKQVPVEYIESCCQAITQFHHFAELIIKDTLRQYHPLLAIDTAGKHEVLFDLLSGTRVEEDKLSGTRSLEFFKSFERLSDLIKKGKIPEKPYGFFVEYSEFLKQLNELRNRIAHRGLFVLRYTALDKLFAGFALPFLQRVIGLERYQDQYFWTPNYIHITIDLLDEMTGCAGKNYDPKKLAVLKEMGRAAYENPVRGRKEINGEYVFPWSREITSRAVALSKHILKTEPSHVSDVRTCPVCGVKSLLLFHEYTENHDDDGNYYPGDRYTFEIKCVCCTFELRSDIGSFDGMNLPVEDFWNL